MRATQEISRDLEYKRGQLQTFFASKRNGDGVLDLSPTELEEVKHRNDELTALGKEYDGAYAEELATANEESLKQIRQPQRPNLFSPGGGDPEEDRRQRVKAVTLGDALVQCDGYKSHVPGRGHFSFGADLPVVGVQEIKGVGLKATFTTGGSTLTGYDRQPGIVMVGQQQLTIADLFAQGQTNLNTIRYIQEDTYTNAATTVAEEGLKPEATFDTSEVDAAVRKIAVIARVTDELFSDFPAVRAYVNERLPFMVEQELEDQLINGDGTAPNISGILDQANIQTQARGTDTNMDAIYKAMTKIRSVGFFEPDGVNIHPDNWTTIRLAKTNDLDYIWGHPSVEGPERIFGLRVNITTAMAAGTALVGAHRLGAQVFYREGLRVEATNSDGEDFRYNRVAIRAEVRAALAVYRPKAFCTVTSLN